MNEDLVKFWMSQKETYERQLEELLQETPLNMERINGLILMLTFAILDIEQYSTGKIRRPNEIENELREKYHLPLKPIFPYLSGAEQRRVETYKRRLEDLSQKKPLDLSRIYNLINVIGHYEAFNEDHYQRIKQELCEKYNIPYVPHEYKIPFSSLQLYPPQESHYAYPDNTALRVVGVSTFFEILALLFGL